MRSVLLALLVTACNGGGGRTGGSGGPAEDAGRDAADVTAADAAPDCELGQVLRDGRCLERCGDAPPCGDDELCVLWEETIACRRKCGRTSGSCAAVEELCYVPVAADEPEGFCAPGECPEGSHKGAWGYCVCDTGDIPPPGLACVVELCGRGNPHGRCPDEEQICVDGVCR